MAHREGKQLTNVYASYPVTTASQKLMQEFSGHIEHIIKNDILLKELTQAKPEITIPSHYHMTIDYAGNIDDIDEYVAKIQKKISNRLQPGAFNTIDKRISKADDSTVVFIKSAGELADILEQPQNDHITAVEISADRRFRVRLVSHGGRDQIQDIWHAITQHHGSDVVEIDTSTIQIRGKIDGQKQLILKI